VVRWTRRASKASVAVAVALLMPAMLAAIALSTDISVWFLEVHRLQLAADSAAVAAALQLKNSSMTSGGSSSFATLVSNEVNAVVGTRLVGTMGTPAIAMGNGNQTISVTLTSTANTFFASALHVGAPSLSVVATAGLVQPPICVLALHPTASGSLAVTNGGTISASTCKGMANSTSSTALTNNASRMNFKALAVTGGYSGTNGPTTSPSPTTGATAAADPYVATTMPAFGACTYTNAYFGTSNHTYSFTSGTRFCGNTEIGGNGSTASFAPGIYYFTGTSSNTVAFDNAIVTSASGVTFVVTGTTASQNPPSFSWTNNSGLTWTAPTSNANGGIAGIAFWQTCPSGTTNDTNVNPAVTFSEGSPVTFSGAFYVPCGQFLLEDGAAVTHVSGSSNSVVASEISVMQGTLTVAASGVTNQVVALMQ
jgi:hypothetical protein